MDKLVFVTAIGAVTPFGRGTDVMWSGLLEGRRAFSRITLFDASIFRNENAGQVKDYDLDDDPPRALRMLFDAVADALDDADDGARRPLERSKTGIVLGTNFGCVSTAEKVLAAGKQRAGEAASRFPPAHRVSSLSGYLFNDTASAVAERFHLGGSRCVTSLSCASGTAVIGLGFEKIRAGEMNSAVVAGFDELTLFNYSGLSALRAITPDIIRPFDARRNGTMFSEGAGCLVLESEESLRKRGVEPLAEVLGWAANNDAYHMTAPDKQGRGIRAVIENALKNAGTAPGQIDHINAHATGTKYNDLIETRALKNVFGEHASELTIAANKSCLGHGMGAAGCWEAAASIFSMRDGKVPPTVGLEEPDPELDLDYCALKAREQEIRLLMSCSYGFGGINAAVVMQRPE